jgi:hypothetical protein
VTARRICLFGVLLLAFGGAFAQGIQRVWAVDDGERIKATVLNHPLATSPDNRVWNGSSISLFGARNEVIAFQLIIQGSSVGATSVNVTLDSLHKASTPKYTIKNTGGIGDPYNFVGKRIEMFVEHYIDITFRSTASWHWWSSARPLPDTDYRGMIPEQLVPFEAPAGPKANGQGGAPFRVSANENQGVWVDIYIPRDAQAGAYTGTLRVTENSVVRYSIPVNLQVYNFALSDTVHLPNNWYIEDEPLYKRHGVANQSAQFYDLMRKYYQIMHRHRANLTHARVVPDTFFTRMGKGYTGEWYTSAYGYDGPGRGIGNNVVFIGQYDQPRKIGGTDWGSFSGFKYNADTNVFKQTWWTTSNKWMSWFNTNAPHVKVYKYGAEEPGIRPQDNPPFDTSAFPDMRRKIRWLKTNPGSGRGMKYLTTSNLFRTLKNAGVDLFLTTGQCGYLHPDDPYNLRASYLVDTANVFRATGTEVGFYTGTRPGMGATVIDAPAIDMRVQAWIMWKYNVDMYSYWFSNNYGDQLDRPIDPWARDLVGNDNGWGDGSGIYAGRNFNSNTSNDRGLNGPIVGIRVKNWRRGAQDYEYFRIARQLALDVNGVVNALVPTAFDKTPQNAQATWGQRGYQYEDMRRRLADLIDGESLLLPSGTFSAFPDTLPSGGGTISLLWTSENATAASIDNGVGNVPLSGSTTVTVSASSVFTLTLSNTAGNRVLTIPVTVLQPPTGAFTVSPDTLPPGGGRVTLSWTSEGATGASVDNGVGSVPVSSSIELLVINSTVFHLTLSNTAGDLVLDAPVTVLHFPSGSFSADPDTLPSGGGNANLSWTSQNATEASIDNGIGAVSLSGSLNVAVTTSTVFHLTLGNAAGSQVLSFPVTVAGTIPPPDGKLVVTPDTLTPGGGNVTLIWVSTNADSAALNHGIGSVATNGTTTVNVDSSFVFELTIRNAMGSRVLTAPVHVPQLPPAPTGTFVALPDSLPAGGGAASLMWISSNATGADIDNGVGLVPINGTFPVNIQTSRTYSLTLSNASGSQVLTAPIRVGAAPLSPSGTFGATPDTLPPGGGNVTLRWTSVNASGASIDNGLGSVALSGSLVVTSTASTIYRLTLAGPGGVQELSVPVVVRNVTQPPTGTFVVNPDTLPAGGGSATLIWVSSGASSASIDNGIGAVPVTGSQTIPVAGSTRFVLSLTNAAGTTTLAATAMVAGSQPLPSATILAVPDSLPSAGGTVMLVWFSEHGSSATIDQGIGNVPLSGTLTVNVSSTRAFRITVANGTGSARDTASVRVASPEPAPTGTFLAVPDTLPAGGGNVTLIWVTSHAAGASIDNGIGTVGLNGSLAVPVAASTTFRLGLVNSSGSTLLAAPVIVRGVPPPPAPTGSFSAEPDTLPAEGGASTLQWSSSGADTAFIDHGIGAVPLSGSLVVNVGASVTYRITFRNRGGEAVQSAHIGVGLPAAAPADVTSIGIPGAATLTPLGQGSRNIEVMRDGVTPPAGSTNPLDQFDSFDGTQKSFDWFGYLFPSPQTFHALIFQEGMHFSDGGWFESLQVQVHVGNDWMTVAGMTSTPAYAGGNGVHYETHDLTFPPVVGDGIRIGGPPGGSGRYSSVAELRVLRPTGPPAPPVASFIALPDTLPPGGGDVTLSWCVDGAQSARIEGLGDVPAEGSRRVRVDNTGDFVLHISNAQGTRSYAAHVAVGKPRDFWLEPNFPNPFNPTTNIRFSVDRQTAVSLVIYDLLGQEVRRLVDEVMSPGTRTLSWDGRDDLGRPQASGTYIYRLKAESFLEAKKMVLLK